MLWHSAQFPQKMTRSRRRRAGILLYFKRLQRQHVLFFVETEKYDEWSTPPNTSKFFA